MARPVPALALPPPQRQPHGLPALGRARLRQHGGDDLSVREELDSKSLARSRGCFGRVVRLKESLSVLSAGSCARIFIQPAGWMASVTRQSDAVEVGAKAARGVEKGRARSARGTRRGLACFATAAKAYPTEAACGDARSASLLEEHVAGRAGRHVV